MMHCRRQPYDEYGAIFGICIVNLTLFLGYAHKIQCFIPLTCSLSGILPLIQASILCFPTHLLPRAASFP
ncbi:hypothetical protein M431DRAFT_243751 [Trichoderma harzianum CBS 226.95]|uniref:Uncharacterized protein n=1 Tax=Trichoderma harzianum CBS 226.95 TaxID=983964 RepID=A0A2T4A0U3_TRIHA|nr:hypothetical protein M431DRAFT_243751 [Trichoderma harzianum CBS 226.95]PTB50679.1 hypothetical protein M431DRAFT_243751 [Trichoderma harzianum CBS 226.95]